MKSSKKYYLERQINNYDKTGEFRENVPADNRRGDFDFGNEQILYLKRSVDILFIGDSITQLWGHYAYFGTKCYIVNRGIDGDGSEYTVRRALWSA